MRYQRRHDEILDWLSRDGETIVLTRYGVVRLSEVGALVFELTQDAVEVGALSERLEEVFGAPAGAAGALDATKDAVTDLVRLGVLRRSA